MTTDTKSRVCAAVGGVCVLVAMGQTPVWFSVVGVVGVVLLVSAVILYA